LLSAGAQSQTGILAKKPDFNQDTSDGGRFDASVGRGSMYRERYWKTSMFEAMKHVGQELGDIKPTEAALRWMQHHSKLDEKDSVIIGGSSLQQIDDNCVASQGGPLPENVLKVRRSCFSGSL
jgi:aflatoxin B1 aldehyde reductase